MVSDVKMLRAILVLLNTQSWCCPPRRQLDDMEEEDDNLAEVKEAVEYITSHFREPLEAKGVVLAGIQDEIEEIVQ